MAKKYTVTVEFKKGGTDSLVRLAKDPEQAKRLAIREWRINPSMAKSITVKEENYIQGGHHDLPQH